MSRKNDDWELEELDLEKELGEQGNDWEEINDWPEESKSLKPGAMLLVFLGLAVLAAIICGILWNITHRDKEEEENMQHTTEISEESAEPEGQGASATPAGETTSIFATDNQEVSEPSFEEMEPVTEPDFDGAAAPSIEDTGLVSEPVSEPLLPEETPEPTPEPASEATPAPADVTETTDANRVSTMDGRVIVFTDCDDTVSPKEYVNLRLEPSTSEGNSTVHCRLNYGETVHRTGISEDSGWSRVEIDGVTCYVVTSFIYVVE